MSVVELDSSAHNRFRCLVHLAGATSNRAAMPWRETDNPYCIFVSEMMLQQTQVARVLPKYSAFIAELPNFRALARASLATVLRLWQGLGYNRRAKFIHSAAHQIVAHHSAQLPDNRAALIALPGIGINTAGALLAFAYNYPVVFIETNIRRVFIHFWFDQQADTQPEDMPSEDHKQPRISDRALLPLIEATLDRHAPRLWYYNLMDWGAQLAHALPNPNRRSRHYNRQSSFAGSNREARGRLLRLLTHQSKGARITELPQLAELSYMRVAAALAQLEQEGFVVCDSGLARIAENPSRL